MENPDLFITVFADASHCPNTKACGWAAWIKYGHPATTQRLQGRQADIGTSNLAELLALQSAIDYIERHIPFHDKILVIQSDCQGALNKLEDRVERLKRHGARHVKLKWVKGHNGRKDSRSAVNSWCDEAARGEMRALREVISRTMT